MSKNSSLATIACSALLVFALGGCSTSAPSNTPDRSLPPSDARMQFRPENEGVRITPDGQLDLEGNPELKKRKDTRDFDSLYDPLPDFVL